MKGKVFVLKVCFFQNLNCEFLKSLILKISFDESDHYIKFFQGYFLKKTCPNGNKCNYMHVFKYSNNEFPHLNHFSFERIKSKPNDKQHLVIEKVKKKSNKWSSSSSEDDEEDLKVKHTEMKKRSHSSSSQQKREHQRMKRKN